MILDVFRFLLLRAFLIRCSNTRIVCSSPYSVGPTNCTLASHSLTVTLVYASQLASHLGVVHILSG